MHFAAFLNNFDSLNFLVENGGKLLQINEQGMTSIDEIIRNDHKDLLSCVLDHVKHFKRDVTQSQSFGIVHLASSVDNSKCLQYLLEEEKLTPNEICNT